MIDYRKIDTADQLEDARAKVAACDIAKALEIGAETWGIIYAPGSQRGQMLRLANGRGAVCFGGNSDWGDWRDGVLVLDDGDYADGDYAYDETGADCGDCDEDAL